MTMKLFVELFVCNDYTWWFPLQKQRLKRVLFSHVLYYDVTSNFKINLT